MTTTDLLREKLIYYKKPIIEKDLLIKLIQTRAPSYTIAEMSKRKLITPLKKGYSYINNESREIVNPYVIGKVYCEGQQYCFGGVGIYNMYQLTTQLANQYTLYTPTYSGEKVLYQQRYLFKKARLSFFWGIKSMNIAGETIHVMSSERALIQMLIDGNSMEFIQEKPASIDAKALLDLAQHYTSKTILSRVRQLLGQR